jgi:Acyl-CoA carboxylase epsilon subunit
MTEEAGSAPVPLLAVTRGVPTPDELAALVIVLASRATEPASGGDARRSSWSAKSRMLRVPVRPGRGAWRASALPG